MGFEDKKGQSHAKEEFLVYEVSSWTVYIKSRQLKKALLW